MKLDLHNVSPLGTDSVQYFNSVFFICQLSEMNSVLRMHSFVVMGDSERILPGVIHMGHLNFTAQIASISKQLSVYNNAARIISLRSIFRV